MSTLRALVRPASSQRETIWLDVEDGPDQLLDESGSIDLVDGMRFFTEIRSVTVRIDRVPYELFVRKLSGAQLRAVPSPDVAADRDLWRDVPDKRDIKVQDEDVVKLMEGMRFFTAPGRINPGRHR